MKPTTVMTKSSLAFAITALFSGAAYAEIPDKEKEPAVTKSTAVENYFKSKDDIYKNMASIGSLICQSWAYNARKVQKTKVQPQK